MIVLLAVYVSVGRTLSSLTGSFQPEILRELNARVPFHIDAQQVSVEWHSFSPVLVLGELKVTVPGEITRSVELSEGRVALDVVGSLVSGALQLTQVRLNGLSLSGELDEHGMLRVRGFEGGESHLGDWLAEFLPSVERVVLGGSRLELLLPGGEQRDFELDLALSRDGSRRRLEGKLLSSRGMQVLVLGRGVGNLLEPESFTGQLYLDIDAADLGAVNDLLPDSLREVLLDGGVGMELWSSWDRGKSTTSVRLQMKDVAFAAPDDSWRVPFERIAFDARLVANKGGWGLSVAALELEGGQARVQVPRVQLDIRGQTLNLRASDLPLAPLNGLLASMDSLPSTALELLQVLQPRGSLPALQLNIADITAPRKGWQLQASFDQLAVDPWHGAPGVTGASGYVELAPGSGAVILDSQQFSMVFPTVYKDPLHYEDFHGTIHIDWDEAAVVLSSGLVQARGPEGVVPVLFGLNIPLLDSEVGLEMDLLVGLQGTHPLQREKYIPFILNEGLRSWLSQSIGDGLIEQGGFLWRGSLNADSASLHTVQLFFNISDTTLRYHPDWPSLAGVDGTVLIDNSRVSVWAERARLIDSAAAALSVEVWQDEAAALWLAINGSLHGPAADGLAVVNQSPLSSFGADVFADWQLSGTLATDLELLLNLSDDRVPPRAGVAVRFVDVDLDILPGSLPVRDINGVLYYDSTTGFSSHDLGGQLWGRPVAAAMSQRAAISGSAGSVAVLDLQSTVDMADVQQWLALDMLGFARGQATVTAQLVAGPGTGNGAAGDTGNETGRSPSVLSIHSTLEGISLDLPEPWSKPAGSARPVQLELTMGGAGLDLGISLDGGLAGRLDLQDGQLRSATVTLGGEPGVPEPGQLRLTGHTAFVDTAQWQRFVSDYLSSDPAPVPPGEAAPSLAVSVDNLQIDQLVADGRNLGQVQLDLAGGEAGQWRLGFRADWLRGELLYVAGGESLLDIQYLDLAGLESAEPAAVDAAPVVEVPAMAVSIDELYWAETLLGELTFDLRSAGPDLLVENIGGSIVALELREQTPGKLVWHRGADSRTTLEASLSFDDLGQSLVQLGYQKIIETEQGSASLELTWPGGPQDFSLLHGEGSLQIDIGRGSFPEAPGGAAGALRVVSIVNLAEIVQRLSLSHMFESGIPFSTVDGEVHLDAGVIEVARMNIEGGASSFQFSGVSAVATRALDGELVVTLPVANNLPWVVALTAGLPVAAGVFLLSKVFENPLNRLTSVVYSATGTWDDPEVRFDRVFDDTRGSGADAEASTLPEAGEEQP